VMEYLPGGTLKKKLTGKPMTWQEAVRILLPIARALGYAHGHKIVHRDVKPSNILITDSGEPMLSDFGIAKMLETEETLDLTGTGVGVGTPEYMSPEQAQGKQVDARSDIYSLGVVLYEMVTGRKPYQADTPMAVIWKLASEPLPRPRQFQQNLPNRVEEVLIKSLSRDPSQRFQTMSDFCRAFEVPAAQKEIVFPRLGKVPILIITGTLLIAAISGFLWWQFAGSLQAVTAATKAATPRSTATLAPTSVPTRTRTRTPTAVPAPTLAKSSQGNANLALNKKTSSSTGSCNSSETPKNAVNGSWNKGLSDKWCAFGTSSSLWWQVDLGSIHTLERIVIYHAGAGGETTDFNTRDFNIQTSRDGVSWSTAVEVGNNHLNITTHDISTEARYVRLNVIAGEQGNAQNVARIYDVQVFENPVPAAQTTGGEVSCLVDEWTISGNGVGKWKCNEGTISGHSNSLDSLLLSKETYRDITLSAEVSTTNREASLALRMNDDGSDGYLIVFIPDGVEFANQYAGGLGEISVKERNDYSEVTLDSYHASNFPRSGETSLVRVVAEGTSIKVFLNKSLVINITDATFTSGHIGIRIFGDTSIPCDALFRNVLFQLP